MTELDRRSCIKKQEWMYWLGVRNHEPATTLNYFGDELDIYAWEAMDDHGPMCDQCGKKWSWNKDIPLEIGECEDA